MAACLKSICPKCLKTDKLEYLSDAFTYRCLRCGSFDPKYFQGWNACFAFMVQSSDVDHLTAILEANGITTISKEDLERKLLAKNIVFTDVPPDKAEAVAEYSAPVMRETFEAARKADLV